MYVYIKSEPQLWTVGFNAPNGKWMPESDHESTESAAKRVSYLNGNVDELLTYEQWESEVKGKGGFVYADKHDLAQRAVEDLGDKSLELLKEIEEEDLVAELKDFGYNVLRDDELDEIKEEAMEEGKEEGSPVCSWDMEKTVTIGKGKFAGGGNIHKLSAMEALKEVVEKKGWQFLSELLEPHTVMHVNLSGERTF